MHLRAGARLRSTVCNTEIIIVRAPTTDIDLTCGGAPLAPLDAVMTGVDKIDPAFADGTQLGKRYTDEALGLQILCTKPGKGSLAVGGRHLKYLKAKQLPASD
jgi:hypothetical protein